MKDKRFIKKKKEHERERERERERKSDDGTQRNTME